MGAFSRWVEAVRRLSRKWKVKSQNLPESTTKISRKAIG